jgi:hypothetical protein
MSRTPWTLDEVREFLPVLKQRVEEHEAMDENIRPLPPMNGEECEEMFFRISELALERPLTLAEHCLLGQVMANYRFAIRAETLGKKGRYFVLSEDDITKMMQSDGHG